MQPARMPSRLAVLAMLRERRLRAQSEGYYDQQSKEDSVGFGALCFVGAIVTLILAAVLRGMGVL